MASVFILSTLHRSLAQMASPDNGIVWPRFVGKAVQLPHARAGVLEGGRLGGHILPLEHPLFVFVPPCLRQQHQVTSNDKQS